MVRVLSTNRRSRIGHAYSFCDAFTHSPTESRTMLHQQQEWTGDFDEFVGDDGGLEFAQLFAETAAAVVQVEDRSGCRSRQLSLGEDIVLSDFIGNMGFDEVTDWEYYYSAEDDPKERKVVQPNPFDKEKPKRTRKSSGSVVRIFRGEFVGMIGGMLGSQGLDKRVLVKEFTGELALSLAAAELSSIGKLQSALVPHDEDWSKTAAARASMKRVDNGHIVTLLQKLQKQPFLGIVGEINLAELEGEMEPNEFYRALGVPPPKPNAIWIVYEYAGLSSLQIYCQPPQVRRERMPPKKGFFGNLIPPPDLPPWKDRAIYVRNIMQQAIAAVAETHDQGIVHRSIGRSSFFLSSTRMDKREASSPFATQTKELVVKLSDYGFSGLFMESGQDEEFRTRARSFGLFFDKNENSIRTANFASKWNTKDKSRIAI